jgi:membrane-associated protein
MLEFVHIILHIDQYLAVWSQAMGPWLYVLMFAIIFAETGLIVTPFLPGDSLLFALGALTTMDSGLDVWTLSISLMIAAFLGDNVNYKVGQYLGPKVFSKKDSRIFNQDHLQKTQRFYEKYGGKAIVLARFVPIVRTFVPFVAGVGQMKWANFLLYNIVGAVLWINIFLFAGHFFGNLPYIKRNFHVVILAVIVVSVLPIVIEFIRHKWPQKQIT